MGNILFNYISVEQLIHCAITYVTYFAKTLADGLFDQNDLNDLAQDVQLQAMVSADKYDPSVAKVSTWVRKIALNTVKTEKAKRLRTLGVITHRIDGDEYFPYDGRSYEMSADNGIRAAEIEQKVNSAVSNDRDRKILRMRADGYENAEIADELGVPKYIVYVVVHNAKSRLDDAA